MTLDGIIGALELHPSAGQRAALQTYVDLLERWNGTYNLTGIRERQAMLTQHLADCLAVVRPMQKQLAKTVRLLDVGSGAGLPGIVIATMLPEYEVTCVDAVAKKAAFIRQAAGSMALSNLKSCHGRVEALRNLQFDAVTSRAVGSLADLVGLTKPLLAPNGRWMAMKGKVPYDEIADLPAHVDTFHVEQLTVPGLAGERCLVWMARTDSTTPRV